MIQSSPQDALGSVMVAQSDRGGYVLWGPAKWDGATQPLGQEALEMLAPKKSKAKGSVT